MLELTINGKVYDFKFGIGFLKSISGTVQQEVEGIKGMKDDIGLPYTVAKLWEGDVLTLIDVLDRANKGFEPRITRDELADYIDEEADIDELFAKVLDFLERSNATKKMSKMVLDSLRNQ